MTQSDNGLWWRDHRDGSERISMIDAVGYHYEPHAERNHAHAYLAPAVLGILRQQGSRRVFDLGCGDGQFAALLQGSGFDVVGVDPSAEGLGAARARFPGLALESGSAYDDLACRFGRFDTVISLEVVEHVYDPRAFARTLFDLVEPGGVAIVSTPYHGYWKNVALALSGRLDRHFTALWDHGYIKFWSMSSLRTLLQDAGFGAVEFRRVGRIPPLAKSMIAIARKGGQASAPSRLGTGLRAEPP